MGLSCSTIHPAPQDQAPLTRGASRSCVPVRLALKRRCDGKGRCPFASLWVGARGGLGEEKGMGRAVSAAERRFSGGRDLCLFFRKQAEIASQAASGVSASKPALAAILSGKSRVMARPPEGGLPRARARDIYLINRNKSGAPVNTGVPGRFRGVLWWSQK